MSSSSSSGKYLPFSQLKHLIENRSLQVVSHSESKPDVVNIPKSNAYENEDLLFNQAMADVTPISKIKKIRCNSPQKPMPTEKPDAEAEVLKDLRNLVENGEGFILSQTAEYMEGAGLHVHPELIRRLHRGDFSIQAFIDLHGFRVPEARICFESFMQDAVRDGKRAVLVVHGRGLSSPRKPILKGKVYEWLTSGPWRKWVLAFSSARSCDGGTGATYVLLRRKPVRHRKRKKYHRHSKDFS